VASHWNLAPNAILPDELQPNLDDINLQFYKHLPSVSSLVNQTVVIDTLRERVASYGPSTRGRISNCGRVTVIDMESMASQLKLQHGPNRFLCGTCHTKVDDTFRKRGYGEFSDEDSLAVLEKLRQHIEDAMNGMVPSICHSHLRRLASQMVGLLNSVHGLDSTKLSSPPRHSL
jgi:uncharacterized protein YlaI